MQKKGCIPVNKTIWTDDMIKFLMDNHDKLTNSELAKHLELRLTVLRDKKYELGLQTLKIINWTKPQTQILIDLWKTTGDAEIAEILNNKYLSGKRFTKKHICKKRFLLNLFRTNKMIKAIVAKNLKNGRHSYLHYDKSSVALSTNYVKALLTRNTDIKNIEQFPELIEVKKLQLQLNRLTR